ncbi:CCA tRNA nucleotidyltransferase [Acidisphaera sp. S103]|uniref:CCA tRNA nucleotidyltransferase n=1 Tax=Acidisphaera sp. S103 TaxID=1747223 RepID=UPI00131E2977|nr:CCA tRNA nucleotidyltransferase [Acidisphaera sp. S103]
MTRADFLTDPALARIWDALPHARVVGGAVRDALAGRPVADLDLATPDPPNAVTQTLKRAGLKVVPTGLSHGTVTAVVDGRGFEVTTLRRDIETDGRHATVAFTTDWREDASRRDFTINAMSMTRDGAVFDYFDGTTDLAAGRIRFVGDAATRIAEDYLRILRFFRFFARFGRMPPDPDTLTALRTGIPGLATLSIERVWHEIRLILAAPDPANAVELMNQLGIWQAAVPEAAAVTRLAGLPTDPVLRLAAMLTGDALGLATRLKLSNEDRDRLLRLLATPHTTGSDADLRRLLADHHKTDLIDRTWLDASPDARQRLSAMTRPVFPLIGRDVVAQGIPAGPAVGALLRTVRQWWMDGGCTANRTACLAELARLANVTKMEGKR